MLRGNGPTTPNKFMRAVSGVLQWLDNSYTKVTASLTDNGIFQAGGIVATTDDIVAQLGNLIARKGAYGTSNPNAGVILQDFSGGDDWRMGPDGFITQWGSAVIPIDASAHLYPLQRSYTSTYAVMAWSGAFSPQATCQIGAQAGTPSNFYMTAASNTNTGNIGVNWLAVGF
jgi:hypothetical protein